MPRCANVDNIRDLIAKDPNWKKYVDGDSIEIIENFVKFESIKKVSEKLNLEYQSVRGKIERAAKRIEAKKDVGLRHGQSIKAKRLIELLSLTNNEELKKILTDTEYKYIKKYQQCNNFNEVARTFDAAPSNVMITIYGSKRRAGVIGKLELSLKNK